MPLYLIQRDIYKLVLRAILHALQRSLQTKVFQFCLIFLNVKMGGKGVNQSYEEVENLIPFTSLNYGLMIIN